MLLESSQCGIAHEHYLLISLTFKNFPNQCKLCYCCSTAVAGQAGQLEVTRRQVVTGWFVECLLHVYRLTHLSARSGQANERQTDGASVTQECRILCDILQNPGS